MSKEYLEALDWLLANEMIYRGRTRLPISPALRDIKHRLESIDNAEPSEALECLENIEANLTGLPKHVTEYDDGFDNYLEDIWNNIDTIKQALLKAQEQEKEKLLFKNIHNTKVKTPLVSIFEGLSKDERFKFTEHIYYHWEEMKEALEDKNNELEKENAELKAKAQKERKALEIIKEKNVDVHWIKIIKDLEAYNEDKNAWEKELTEEEFNLLKEVLE